MTEKQINDLIDKWHESSSELKLHQYLGLTITEYTDFVKTGNLWEVTDPDCRQMRLKISDYVYRFKEDRIVNPETKETKVFELEIDIKEYSLIELYDTVSAYGYTMEQLRAWLDSKDVEGLALISECIFEQTW